MLSHTSIEWTESTWNPVRGCSRVSEGCRHCYAERQGARFCGPGLPYNGFVQISTSGPRWTGEVQPVPEALLTPLTTRKPQVIFVNSMSDLFHERLSDAEIIKIAAVMAAAKWHTFQVLTKRSARMQRLLNGKLRFAADCPHIWWGVSVENRRQGVPRIADLQKSAARNRFLSIEPLLEDLGRISLRGIHWVIVGGESGPDARPMKADWVRSIRRQCRRARVPFFFKQWGSTRKSAAGRELDGRIYDKKPF